MECNRATVNSMDELASSAEECKACGCTLLVVEEQDGICGDCMDTQMLAVLVEALVERGVSMRVARGGVMILLAPEE